MEEIGLHREKSGNQVPQRTTPASIRRVFYCEYLALFHLRTKNFELISALRMNLPHHQEAENE